MKLKLTTQQAYEDANRFDEAFNKGLELNPPAPENFKYWLCYIRTVRTSLDLIEGSIMDKLKKN